MLFIQFSSIVGTLCTFTIAIHTVVLASLFAHKYVFIKCTLTVKRMFFVKRIFSCCPELEVHALNNQCLRYNWSQALQEQL